MIVGDKEKMSQSPSVLRLGRAPELTWDWELCNMCRLSGRNWDYHLWCDL